MRLCRVSADLPKGVIVETSVSKMLQSAIDLTGDLFPGAFEHQTRRMESNVPLKLILEVPQEHEADVAKLLRKMAEELED